MLKTVKNRHADALTRLPWQDFERLLAAHYRDLGYEIEHHGTGTSGAMSDGGIDLKLRKGAEYLLVQCKHWNAMQVPHNDVHQLMGIMDNEDATGAILVTSGEFTAAAIQAAGKKGRVQLIDGAALRGMLGARLPPESLVGPARRRGKKDDTKIKKLLVSLIGFGLIVVVILLAKNFIIGQILSLGPPPATTTEPANPSLLPSETARHVQPALLPPDASGVGERRPTPDEAIKVLEATTPELKD